MNSKMYSRHIIRESNLLKHLEKAIVNNIIYLFHSTPVYLQS